jgi:undecaprenyl-diphosphatase
LSGHTTLHAVAFSILLIHAYPLLASAATLVAASRIVLGPHYPSGVLAGAAIGALNATGAVLLTH